MILKIAHALGAHADEPLPLAKEIPESVRRRGIQRPDVFPKLAALGDEQLVKILEDLGDKPE